jgi:hypothetical protein
MRKLAIPVLALIITSCTSQSSPQVVPTTAAPDQPTLVRPTLEQPTQTQPAQAEIASEAAVTAFPDLAKEILASGVKNLAQVYTQVKYTREGFTEASEALLAAMREQGFPID